MLFELHHSLDKRHFTLSTPSHITVRQHLHRSFEFFYQTDGVTKVTVGDKTYTVEKGKAVLIFPFQLHSYECIQKGNSLLVIFSPDLVNAFQKSTNIPLDNSLNYPLNELPPCSNIYQQKAFAYSVIGAFENTERIYTTANSKDNIIIKMLLYAESNFSMDCSLKKAAKELCYDYMYVSKLFKTRIGVSYTTYVHYIRINEAVYLLENTTKSIMQIYIECGFSCLRTFNRVFASLIGVSPSAYRKTIKK